MREIEEEHEDEEATSRPFCRLQLLTIIIINHHHRVYTVIARPRDHLTSRLFHHSTENQAFSLDVPPRRRCPCVCFETIFFVIVSYGSLLIHVPTHPPTSSLLLLSTAPSQNTIQTRSYVTQKKTSNHRIIFIIMVRNSMDGRSNWSNMYVRTKGVL